MSRGDKRQREYAERELRNKEDVFHNGSIVGTVGTRGRTRQFVWYQSVVFQSETAEDTAYAMSGELQRKLMGMGIEEVVLPGQHVVDFNDIDGYVDSVEGVNDRFSGGSRPDSQQVIYKKD